MLSKCPPPFFRRFEICANDRVMTGFHRRESACSGFYGILSKDIITGMFRLLWFQKQLGYLATSLLKISNPHMHSYHGVRKIRDSYSHFMHVCFVCVCNGVGGREKPVRNLLITIIMTRTMGTKKCIE